MPIKYPITNADTETEEKFVNFLIKTFHLEQVGTNFSNLLAPEYHQKGQVNFLMIAASKGYFSLASRLATDNIARIDDQDCTGHTALMVAAKGNHENIIQRLLKLGADRHIKNKLEKNASDYASTDIIKHWTEEKHSHFLVPNLTLPNNDDTDSDFDIIGLPSNDSND